MGEHAGGANRGHLVELLERARRENWDVEFVWVSPGPNTALTGSTH